MLRAFKTSRCLKASFYNPENRLNFLATRGFRTNISMKLAYQYMAIFFTLSPTSNHLHPLQVENCDSNSRLVVDGDDNVKSGLKGLIFTNIILYLLCFCMFSSFEGYYKAGNRSYTPSLVHGQISRHKPCLFKEFTGGKATNLRQNVKIYLQKIHKNPSIE